MSPRMSFRFPPYMSSGPAERDYNKAMHIYVQLASLHVLRYLNDDQRTCICIAAAVGRIHCRFRKRTECNGIYLYRDKMRGCKRRANFNYPHNSNTCCILIWALNPHLC